MPDLELLEPRAVDEAAELLARHGEGAKIIAGGTALVLLLQNRLIAPSCLISLVRVAGLDAIRHEPGTGLRIGALTTIREAELSPVIAQHCPVLSETFGRVANVRVRNAATIGGNLAEADYASDPPAVLVGLRARVAVASIRGVREIRLTEFFTDFYETTLAEDEIVTELIVPEQPVGQGAAYLRFVTRSSEDRPCVGVAAFVELESDGRCRELRVTISAVAETPRELASAEALAVGQRLTEPLRREIAEQYARAIEPLSDLRGSAWYRKQMIEVFTRRAIEAALERVYHAE